MTRSFDTIRSGFLAALWLGSSFVVAEELPDDFFATSVRPILEQHCVTCHSGAKAKGGLRLTDRTSMLAGGDSGPAIDADDVDESLLLAAVNYDAFEMPPTGKLAQPRIDTLHRWIASGAPWPDDQAFEVAGAGDQPAFEVPQVNDETKRFWSFQPIRKPNLPVTTDPQGWPRNEIDQFVLAKLTAAGLRPNDSAPRAVLFRRAHYDLLGLPPTSQQVAAFVDEEATDSFSKLVDELLASPHYGEKWARHWLDLVRFAESNSYERDTAKPNAWKYRDYVIRSFNEDKPYDQFIREQLAGDEMDERTDAQVIATGFYRLGPWDDEPADERQSHYDELDDILTTTCQTFLGLTVNCARCHDHKLDPMPQADYYRLLSFFAGVTRYGGPDRGRDLRFSQVALASWDQVATNQAEVNEFEKELRKLNENIGHVEGKFRSKLPGGERDDFAHDQHRVALVEKHIPDLFTQADFDDYVELRRLRDELQKQAPNALPKALAVTEVGKTPPEMRLLIRGNPHSAGELVEPGFPSVLDLPPPQITEPEHERSSGRRTALADWVASESNPLTARVIANRVWQFHFGQGLVTTPNNFGLQGEPPSHPKLLDWLAAELMEHDWSLKHLHRLIMNSATYQMASDDNAQALASDPQNRLLWRFSMRRLTAEEIRDSILAVNGRLNKKMGGPSIYTKIPAEVLAGQSRPGEGWGQSTVEERARRSIYIFVKRSLITPLIASFDGADTDFTCPVRFTTTQPTQSLSMVNGEYIHEQASALQAVIDEQVTGSVAAKIEFGLRRVLQREPDKAEIEHGVELVNSLVEQEEMSPAAAFHGFCVVALNLNEFIYLD
jgi:mono/diheme cytochrome c family protein